MARKQNTQMKKVRTVRIIGYQNANAVRKYMKLMGMYGSEALINPENLTDGSIFTTTPINLEDWLRLSKYVFTVLNGDGPVSI